MPARLATIAVTAMVVAAGCGSSSKDASTTTTTSSRGSGSELTATPWVLASFRSDRSMRPAVAGAEATLRFETTGRFVGSTGCNNISGTYIETGRRLTMTVGPMTLAACPDGESNAQEQAVTSLLPDVTGYSVVDGLLTLSGETGPLLTYGAGSADLTGSWAVTGVNNGKGGVVSSAATEPLTGTFAEDGSFAGFGGCNQLSGPYRTSGRDGVAIGPIASTMASCEGETGQVEAEYVAALQASSRFQIDGSRLTLRDGSGSTQVTATRSDG